MKTLFTSAFARITSAISIINRLGAVVALILAAALLAASASQAATIYVANSGNNTITKFTDGVGSVFANTGLSSPQGLALDKEGNLYVANWGNNTIVKFTPGGVGSVFASTGLNGPVGLGFDSAGNLFVGNQFSGAIVKFTPGGVGSVFATGYSGASAIAFDNAGNLYTTAGPGNIYKFTPGGVGSSFASGLNQPTLLAFDTAGNLYAGSYGNNRIDKFTPGGVGSIFANTGLNYPYGMAFDSQGNLYVANVYGNTIQKFTPGGVGSVFANTGLNGPTGIAIAPEKTIYVSNAGNNTITKFTDGVGSVFANTGLSSPQGLALDKEGNLYVANRGNNTIMKFTPGGVGSLFASIGLNGPQGLAFDSAGNLYVANIAGGTIMKFTPGGVGSLFATVGMPSGLAFDSAGNLFATTVGFTITKFTLGGVGSLFAHAGAAPGGLAFDTAGNLYVGNGDDNTIGKFTPAAVGSIFASTGLSGPEGVAFDNAGNLYVVNNHNDTVQVFTPAGVGSTFANTGLNAPTFIAVHPFNNPSNTCVPAPSGLVGWWKGDNNALDSAGTNNGTLAGNTTCGAARVGQGFVFDGNLDGVQLANQTNLQLQNFTIEAWIQRSSTTIASQNLGGGLIFSYGSGGYGLDVDNDGHVYLVKNDINSVMSSFQITDTNWHHLAVTKSGTSVVFYLDGVAYPAAAYSVSFTFTAPPAIGARGDGFGNSFLGTIDEVSVYNRALGANEVQAIYNAGSSGKCTSPPPPTCVPAPLGVVSWWRAEGNALDSADSNHGTLAGNTTYGAGRVGQAFVFDGNGDAVRVGNPPSLQLQNFTIETWIRRASAAVVSQVAGDAGIFTYGHGGYSLGINNNGTLFLSKVDFDAVLLGTGITDTNFHHVAVTKSGVAVVFYIDGVAHAVPAYSTTFVFSTPAAIGARGDTLAESFLGDIDELSIYNGALSATEVQAIYNAGSAGKCAPTPPPTCVTPPSGLVSWWRGENSTADAADGNNGMIAGTGTVTYGPGVVGQAFVFDGTHRDRVNIGNPTNLRLEDFTLEAWVKRSSPEVTSFDILGADGSVTGDTGIIFSYGRGGYGFGLANNGRMLLSRIDLDAVISAPLVTDTNWHHLAVTKAGLNAVFYVDGVPQATPAYVHPAPYTFDDGTCACSAAFSIGSRGDGRGSTFFGMIDEPAVYNRALTAPEIQAIYNAGSTGKCQEPPVILTQPVSQKVTVGLNATFSVVASGTPQLRYQWRFNGDDLAGATTSTLGFVVGEASGGLYSVRVTNAFGSVLSSNALLVVNHPPVADASATLPLVISLNNTNATVVLDGSRSSDPESDPLQYYWLAAGAADPFATGIVAVVTLPVGSNALTLTVDDGLATESQTFGVEVITPAQAVERLVALVNSGAPRPHPLIATLSAALAAIDRSNPTAAINQLMAFQNQVRAQVSPLDPVLAETFIQMAQEIIDSLSAGSGETHGRITHVSREADGKMRLKGEAAPGALYIIEASTNLVDWEMIGVATENGAGTFEFEDANSAPMPARFYRIASP